MPPHEIWKQVLETLENNMNKVVFEMLMKQIEPLDLVGDTFNIAVTGEFAMEQLNDHRETIENTIHGIVQMPVTLNMVYREAPASTQAPVYAAPTAPQKREEEEAGSPLAVPKKSNTTLNDMYTFDSFVVGESNQFCYNTSRAVAEKPGAIANPLFIYGDVGLGKTHLLHAIGNYVTATRPDLVVVHRHAAAFVNEMMNYIREGRIVDFRNKYLHADLFLIDDIHNLRGKEGTQTEFFQIFNNFYETKKQIVVTCDRPPKELKELEERVVSRLGWGVIADIGTPNYETRLAILKRKLEKDNLSDKNIFPEEVLEYIATMICTNIRDLEGALMSIMARAKYNHQLVDIKLAEEIINHIAPMRNPQDITPHAIIKTVCANFNIKEEDVLGKKRKKEIVQPRMISMYLIREITNAPLATIGEIYNKDHTTVLYSCEKIGNLMNTDPYIKKVVNSLRDRITG